ncbi:DUF1573 domain-containing protein [Planctomycetota bacterium]
MRNVLLFLPFLLAVVAVLMGPRSGTGVHIVDGALGRGPSGAPLFGADSSSTESPPVGASRSPSDVGGVTPTELPKGVFVEATTIDFGRVGHGQVVKRRFRLQNTGSKRLTIGSLRSSCGCTAAVASRRSLEPGEWAEVEASFDTATRQFLGAEKLFRHYIDVRLVDESRSAGVGRAVRLVLEGLVVTQFRVVPAGGAVLPLVPESWSQAQKGARVEIYPLNGEAALLAGAKVLSAPRGVRVVGPVSAPSADEPRGIAVTVVADEDAEPGPIHGMLRISTAATDQPVVSVPVFGRVLATVRALPATLVIPKDLSERGVHLALSARESGVRFVRAEVSSDAGAPAAVEVIAPPAPVLLPLTLTVRLRKEIGAIRGGQRGAIRVYATDVRTPVVLVPYRIRDAGLEGELRLRAAEGGVRIAPITADAGTVDVGEERELSFGMRALGEALLEPSGLEVAGDDQLTARCETLRPGLAERLYVTFTGRRPGPLSAAVRFRPRRGQPKLEVLVRGRVRRPLFSVPAAVYLARAEPFGSVLIRHRKERRFSVTRLRDGTGRLELESEPWSAGAVRVRVRAREGDKGGELFGPVWVETDVPAEEPLMLTVFGEL